MTSESQNQTQEHANEVRTLRATLPAATLCTIAQALAPIATEAQFRLDPRAEMVLEADVVDAAHVALVSVRVARNAFQTFEGDAFDVSIDVEDLGDRAKSLDGKLPANLVLTAGAANGGLTLAQGGLTRSLPLGDGQGVVTPKVPTLNLAASTTVDVAALLKGIKALKAVSDHVTFRIRDGRFDVSAMRDAQRDSWTSDREAIGIGVSLFSVDYLERILRGLKRCVGEARIELGTDYPVAISAQAGDVSVRYLLAPRIEDVASGEEGEPAAATANHEATVHAGAEPIPGGL